MTTANDNDDNDENINSADAIADFHFHVLHSVFGVFYAYG